MQFRRIIADLCQVGARFGRRRLKFRRARPWSSFPDRRVKAMPCFVDSIAAASGDSHLHGGKDSGLRLVARVVRHHAVPATQREQFG
jgi:hypothetical protein